MGSLPKAKASTRVKAVSSATSFPSDPTLAKITELASRLPPSAPSDSDLNPLADLVGLFDTLPLELSSKSDAASARKREANRQTVHSCFHTLKAVFETLINQGRIHGTPRKKSISDSRIRSSVSSGSKAPVDASVNAVKGWLTKLWTEFIITAAKVTSSHWDAGVRISVFNGLMSLVRTESHFMTSLHPTRSAVFARSTFALIVKSIIQPSNSTGLLGNEIREEWMKWWERYDDIRYYFLQEAAVLLSLHNSQTPSASKSADSDEISKTPESLTSNTLEILESLTTMPTVSSEINEWWCSTPVVHKSKFSSSSSKKRKLADSSSEAVQDGSTGVFDSQSSDDSEANDSTTLKLSSKESKRALPPLLNLSSHKRAFQDCWLALLALPLDASEAKRVLVILHRQVLPHMTDPRRLMDWLVDCANAGGTIGILALNGLFTLMQKHSLEFPDFFVKLYALLDRDVLHVRYRPRFFRLLEIFMGSSHLPSALVASFIKRMARLSLSAPPAAIVTVIPFIYNLLKLHPSCMPMIHRQKDSEHHSELNDPYDGEEADPMKTGAILSSLWELSTLRSHYSAPVSGLANIFGEVMSKQNYIMEDFLDHSYTTMFETEITRKIRNAPALAPVPERQPIGNSFFPSVSGSTQADDTLMTNTKRSDDSENEKVERDPPVDLVSALWTF